MKPGTQALRLLTDLKIVFILTHFGAPTPWNPEEVQVLLAKIRQEINAPGLHAYCLKRRVWAQKPFDKVN